MSDNLLSDDDVKAIAKEVVAQLTTNFYNNLGRGVLDLFKKVFFPLLLIIALYGMAHQKEFFSMVVQGGPSK